MNDTVSSKSLGTAGDCYSWSSCEDARKGSFKIDLKLNGVFEAEIDWTRTGNWTTHGEV